MTECVSAAAEVRGGGGCGGRGGGARWWGAVVRRSGCGEVVGWRGVELTVHTNTRALAHFARERSRCRVSSGRRLACVDVGVCCFGVLLLCVVRCVGELMFWLACGLAE